MTAEPCLWPLSCKRGGSSLVRFRREGGRLDEPGSASQREVPDPADAPAAGLGRTGLTGSAAGHRPGSSSVCPELKDHLAELQQRVVDYEVMLSAEALRRAAEREREANEDERQVEESGRRREETLRFHSEADRQDSEEVRRLAETARSTAEAARRDAEEARRIAAELEGRLAQQEAILAEMRMSLEAIESADQHPRASS